MPSQFVLVPLLCFLIYFAWSCVLPINQAPDEETRLAIPFYIVSNGCLPNGFDESIRNQIWGISYAFTPYGSSLLSALFVKIVTMFGAGSACQVVAARLSSCLFGALTVYVVMRIAVDLGFADLTAIVIGTCLGFLPQFAFLSSYLNNDIFSAFCTAMVVWSWVRGIKFCWATGECILLGVSLGLLSLSYYFAYALIPISAVYFLVTAALQGHKRSSLFAKAGLVFVVASALGGWFFIRNAIIYSGDFLGMRSYSECAELYAMETFKPSDHWTLKSDGQAFMSPLTDPAWLSMTFTSCIGYLGYMAYPLPSILVKIAGAFGAAYIVLPVMTGGAPLILGNSGCASKNKAIKWVFVASLLCSILCPILFSAYRSWATDWEPQGRYIISSWIVVFVLISWGLDSVLKRLGTSAWKKALLCAPLIVLTFAMVVGAVIVFWPAGFAGVVY